MNLFLKLGFSCVNDIFFPFNVDLKTHPHFLICGGSGSGKSVFLLYLLNQLLDTNIQLYIGDFKGSGDFATLSPKYAEFEQCIGLIEEFYDKYQFIKQNKTGEHILLIFDEYAGFLVWLESIDKKKATEIKGKIAEILMQGRALAGGGSAWFWCICQRADSNYFSNGARENFMCSIGFSRLSKESKTMLGFYVEDIPEDYEPCTGKALISVDGQPLSVLQVPQIDVSRLKRLLEIKAKRKRAKGTL